MKQKIILALALSLGLSQSALASKQLDPTQRDNALANTSMLTAGTCAAKAQARLGDPTTASDDVNGIRNDRTTGSGKIVR